MKTRFTLVNINNKIFLYQLIKRNYTICRKFYLLITRIKESEIDLNEIHVTVVIDLKNRKNLRVDLSFFSEDIQLKIINAACDLLYFLILQVSFFNIIYYSE
ncbi:hypothetical protein PUN28_011381 [Cardiocondyla obscurior]|uniref:Uncharacterized protein n=1 Tax=Cardiocondyla obscurior TaxID=286306 RepID=A0AAW2FIM9_9HYME